VANAAKRNWNTQQGGVRAQALYGELTLTSAFSITGSGNSIQSPWGNSPNYVLMMDRDFNRANEKAVLFGAAYDLSKLVAQGLSANFNVAAGWDAINPKKGTSAPDQREYNLTVDARQYRAQIRASLSGPNSWSCHEIPQESSQRFRRFQIRPRNSNSV
jgi:hypothetical protein